MGPLERRVSRQYSSFKYQNRFFDINARERLGVTRSQIEVAHLTLDPARIAAATLGCDAFLENFFQYVLMEAFTQLRGE